MTPQGVAILGSTGSIGTTALKVLSRQRERFEVTALTAHSNAQLLGEQVDAFSPRFVGLVNSGESGRAGGTRDRSA
jgi:1-deoxy-D-xylulose-5-phosphate reductoisomerase